MRFRSIVTSLLSALLLLCQASRGAPTTAPARFANEIAAFEKSDRQHVPPQDANLFIGSSSIARWNTLAADFSGVPVINRGFGGSTLVDSTHYASRIVLPYHPRRIFLYAGDNDLAAGRSPRQVLADLKAFVETVRAGQPEVPVYFISIKPSPARAQLLQKAKEANGLAEAYIRDGKDLHYIDVFTPMLGPDGAPRPELFGPDHLHMNADGYALWVKIISPLLQARPQ